MGKGTLLASVYNTRIQEIKESSGMRVEGRDSEQAALALVRLWRTYNLPLSALFRSGWKILRLSRNKWMLFLIIINLYTRNLIIETLVLFWKNDNSFVGRLNVNFKSYPCQHLKCLLFYILNKEPDSKVKLLLYKNIILNIVHQGRDLKHSDVTAVSWRCNVHNGSFGRRGWPVCTCHVAGARAGGFEDGLHNVRLRHCPQTRVTAPGRRIRQGAYHFKELNRCTVA